jgi:hypothetical protein
MPRVQGDHSSDNPRILGFANASRRRPRLAGSRSPCPLLRRYPSSCSTPTSSPSSPACNSQASAKPSVTVPFVFASSRRSDTEAAGGYPPLPRGRTVFAQRSPNETGYRSRTRLTERSPHRHTSPSRSFRPSHEIAVDDSLRAATHSSAHVAHACGERVEHSADEGLRQFTLRSRLGADAAIGPGCRSRCRGRSMQWAGGCGAARPSDAARGSV